MFFWCYWFKKSLKFFVTYFLQNVQGFIYFSICIISKKKKKNTRRLVFNKNKVLGLSKNYVDRTQNLKLFFSAILLYSCFVPWHFLNQYQKKKWFNYFLRKEIKCNDKICQVAQSVLNPLHHSWWHLGFISKNVIENNIFLKHVL